LLDPRYAYISAYLKAEEPNVVNSRHIDRILTTSNLRDAIYVIRKTDIGSFLSGGTYNTFEEIDRALWNYLSFCVRSIEAFKFLPADMSKLTHAYIQKYDVHNIKSAIQAMDTIGDQDPMIPIGVIHENNLLYELSCSENPSEVIEILNTCKLGSYIPVLKEYEPEQGIRDKLLLGATLDGIYYNSMLKIIAKIRDGYVMAQVIGTLIDCTNLQIVVRAAIDNIGSEVADYIIPGGYMLTDKAIKDLLSVPFSDLGRRLKDVHYYDLVQELVNSYDRTKSIVDLQETLETYRFRILKNILSPTVLSPLVMVWYLVLKEIEIRNLRIVFRIIYDNASVENIKRYLIF
jgi:vacuolar-type H+-ATPase subunit C/Vma6